MLHFLLTQNVFIDLYQYTKCGFVGYLNHRVNRMNQQE
ncbi:hypothetical protein mEp044_111 [Escherichia phage mEp044]